MRQRAPDDSNVKKYSITPSVAPLSVVCWCTYTAQEESAISQERKISTDNNHSDQQLKCISRTRLRHFSGEGQGAAIAPSFAKQSSDELTALRCQPRPIDNKLRSYSGWAQGLSLTFLSSSSFHTAVSFPSITRFLLCLLMSSSLQLHSLRECSGLPPRGASISSSRVNPLEITSSTKPNRSLQTLYTRKTSNEREATIVDPSSHRRRLNLFVHVTYPKRTDSTVPSLVRSPIHPFLQ